jgi:hypothetical protein
MPDSFLPAMAKHRLSLKHNLPRRSRIRRKGTSPAVAASPRRVIVLPVAVVLLSVDHNLLGAGIDPLPDRRKPAISGGLKDRGDETP